MRTLEKKEPGEEQLSLGLTTLRANGQHNSRPVVVGSFVTPDPRLLVSDPKDDWYLNMSVIGTLRRGETAVVTKTIPGLIDHYIDLGLLQRGAEVVEVTPDITRLNGRSIYNHTVTDPLVLAGRSSFDKSATLVSFFSSDHINRHADRVGLRTMDMPDSTRTNNKALLRDSGIVNEYEFKMLPGRVFSDYSDLSTVVREFSGVEHGAWIKLALGSGGDYVIHIPEVTETKIINARNKMYRMARKYFEMEGFQDSFDRFWPAKSFSPSDYHFVIEIDARNLGKVTNGSTQLVTHRDGRVDVIFHSEQLTTPEGIFLGSRPLLNGGPELRDTLRREAEKVGRYNITENRYYGLQGIDWFLIQNGSVREYYLTELNSRPIITTPAMIIAEKIGCEYWINTNVYTKTPVNNINDFREIIGMRLTDIGSRTPQEQVESSGFVVPIAFRTLIAQNGRAVASPNFKVLICGDSPQHCQDIVSELKGRSVDFTEKRY